MFSADSNMDPCHKSRPENRQGVEQHECDNREGRTGICFNFEKKGACLIRRCKYIHMDRIASYPNYSNDLKGKRSDTEYNAHKLYGSDRNDNRNIFKVVDRACYGAYFVAHVFKYLAPNFVSGRPA